MIRPGREKSASAISVEIRKSDLTLFSQQLHLEVAHFLTTIFGSIYHDRGYLLVKLSGGELVSTDTFDQLAKDINKNASDAATALKITVPSGNMALISTAASEAARLYIEHKRQGYLIDAIKNNQDLVQQYSDACIALIHIMRGNLKAYYADKLEPIKVAWNASSGKGRQQQTESMLSLNEQFATALGVLQELEKTYTALPKAHAELTKSINNPSLDLEGVQQLYSSGMRLQRLYSELKKTS